jgi:hypothetical protein
MELRPSLRSVFSMVLRVLAIFGLRSLAVGSEGLQLPQKESVDA